MRRNTRSHHRTPEPRSAGFERRLIREGWPEIVGYAELEQLLTLYPSTLRTMACSGERCFPQTFKRGLFRRSDFGKWFDEDPENIRYLRSARQIMHPSVS